MAKVLIVEDDPFIGDELQARMLKENYVVELALDGEDGLYRLKRFEFDVAIVDWNLPGLSGVEICQRIRAVKPTMPLLMLTSRNSVDEKIEGLDSGAFDYLVKPCVMDELFARLRSLLRRVGDSSEDINAFGDLRIHPHKREAFCHGEKLSLSATEFDILQIFLQNTNHELDSLDLARRIGKEESDGLRERMRTHIKNLRQKLEEAKSSTVLEFRHSLGYLLISKNDLKN